MRDHSTIVKEAGAQALGRALQGEGLEVSPSTPQRWADRDNIPGEYWATIDRLGFATLSELARAADVKRRSTAVTA